MKKNKFILFLFFIFVSFYAFPWSDNSLSGGKAAGMANAFVSQSDITSAFHNQAGLTDVKTLSLGIIYENRYLLKELSYKGIVLVIPTATGNFALHYSSSGPSRCFQSRASLAFSKRLFKRISSGLQINFYNSKFTDENLSTSAVGIEMGFIYVASKKTSLGIHLSNPFTYQVNSSNPDDKIRYCIRIGGHTQYAKRFLLSYEAEKKRDQDIGFKAGIEWIAENEFILRGGFNTNPITFFGGFSYQFNSFTADFSSGYNPLLGYSPSVTLTFKLK